jgi:transposase-like protein
MIYSEKEHKNAVDFYFNNGYGYRGTCKALSYPKDYHVLKEWVLKDERYKTFKHKKSPKRYDVKFKAKAIVLYKKDFTISEIADELKVHITSVRKWINQYREDECVSKASKLSDEDIKNLIKENNELKLKNDVLSEIKKELPKKFLGF